MSQRELRMISIRVWHLKRCFWHPSNHHVDIVPSLLPLLLGTPSCTVNFPFQLSMCGKSPWRGSYKLEVHFFHGRVPFLWVGHLDTYHPRNTNIRISKMTLEKEIPLEFFLGPPLFSSFQSLVFRGSRWFLDADFSLISKVPLRTLFFKKILWHRNMFDY